MLPRIHRDGERITVRKSSHLRGDVSLLGAFSTEEIITVTLSIPRILGASSVVLRRWKDGTDLFTDFPLDFVKTDWKADEYSVALSPLESGLYYYQFLFLRAFDTLFSDTEDNVHLLLSPTPGRKFRFLYYTSDFHTPTWFHGGVMYHIFLDRFCKGDGAVQQRPDSLPLADWEKDIPQFAEKNGQPLKNNLFFGGNLWGVIEKLDYLQDLGVTTLYLSPIFTAQSNHRYDTADYEEVDKFLGGEEALRCLLDKAHERGMHVILDGVFNHTGSHSKYFNKDGFYPVPGAYQGENSPYYHWYTFKKFPNDYECWWDMDILPRLNGECSQCRDYFTGEKGICSKWVDFGIDGWRLDVADELTDEFLENLRKNTKCKKDVLLLGEVWENASDKIAYGKRRKYFQGKQLDSVMNYPFRTGILALILKNDTKTFSNILTDLYSSYPKCVSDSLMNVLGTHDTERILTLLGGENVQGLSNRELSVKRMSPEQRNEALKRMKVAVGIQFTVFGVPSVYYGDEAGMEGYHDPFCRMPFPWNHIDKDLHDYYKFLSLLRRNHPCLTDGDFAITRVTPTTVDYRRSKKQDALTIHVDISKMTIEFEEENGRI